MHFQVHKSTDGQYYVKLVAKNGECLMTSEMYKNEAYCHYIARRIEEMFDPNPYFTSEGYRGRIEIRDCTK